MKTDYTKVSDTQAELVIEAGEEQLKKIKVITQKRLRSSVSAPGFRKGKVPLNLVEKYADDNYFKSQFLDDALTELYRHALKEHTLRPLSQPEVEIQKFVPFTEISFKVSVQVVPPIKLADYKKISKKLKVEKVMPEEIEEVLDNLRTRLSTKKSVERAAQNGDEVVIDFSGSDAKDKPVAGASGSDYPLTLGSSQFIDGFEENLEGLKAGDEKRFTLTFPKDYQHKPLANKDVTFSVTVKSISEITLPKVDDDFAKKIGAFKTIKELKDDITLQLTKQKEQEAEAKLKDAIIEELVTKSKLEVPQVLVDENLETLLIDFKQNLMYRGMTFPEYLEQAGLSEEEYKKTELLPRAEQRVKTGLILAEVSNVEKIELTDEEVAVRMQVMRQQYQNDPQMIAQLNTPEAESEIASRIVTEKTVEKLVEYASK